MSDTTAPAVDLAALIAEARLPAADDTDAHDDRQVRTREVLAAVTDALEAARRSTELASDHTDLEADAVVAVKRHLSSNAFTPEWEQHAVVIPTGDYHAPDREAFARRGYELLPITATVHGTRCSAPTARGAERDAALHRVLAVADELWPLDTVPGPQIWPDLVATRIRDAVSGRTL